MAELDLEQIALDCLARLEAEGDTALEELCARHPGQAEKLRAMVTQLRKIGLVEPAEEAAPERIGSYRLLRRIGAGGMGIVHLAEDERVGRRVALKVMREAHLVDARARERFQREVEAIARLEHPGICTLYEAGEFDGVPFLAMRYVEGQTLAERLEKWRAAQKDVTTTAGRAAATERVDAVVTAMAKVAEAVHSAHEHGVIHRDLKPANIVFDGDDQPVVLDFGLARLVDAAQATLTKSGDRLGTPAYMAPEQVDGDGHSDERTDVYALGATLYEAATLRSPFDGARREVLYRRILTEEPPDPRSLEPQIGRDLSAVIGKAMSKEPRRRYTSAKELADELRAVTAGEPVKARLPGPVARMWRWGKRNRAAAAVMVAVSAALAVSIAMLQQRDSAMRELEVIATLGLANDIRGDDPLLSYKYVRRALERDADARYPEVVARMQEILLELPDVRAIGKLPGTVQRVHWAPDGRSVLALGQTCRAELFAVDGSWSHRFEAAAIQAAWQPGGELLALAVSARPRPPADASETGAPAFVWPVVLHRVTAGRVERVRPPMFHERVPTGLYWGPDGQLLVTHVEGATLWSADDTSLPLAHQCAAGFWQGGFLPDGRIVAAGAIWSPAGTDPEPLDAGTLGEDEVYKVVIGDGFVVTGHGHGQLTLRARWWSNDGRPLRTVEGLGVDSSASLSSIALSPDGRRTLIGAYGGTFWLDAGEESVRKVHLPSGRSILAVGFHAGGILVGDWSGAVHQFDNELRLEATRRVRGGVYDLAVDPCDPARFATASTDGVVRVWNTRPRSGSPALDVADARAAVDGGGRQIVAGYDGIVRLLGREGEVLMQQPIPAGYALPAFTPDGRRAVVACHDGTVLVWDLASDTLRQRCRLPMACEAPALFFGDDVLIQAGRWVYRLPLDGDAEPTTDVIAPPVQSLALDRERGALFAGRWNGLVQVVDLRGGGPARTLRWIESRKPITALAVSSRGDRLLVGCADFHAYLLDADSGDEVAVLGGARHGVSMVSFGPGDGTAATVAMDGGVRIYDVVAGRLWPRITLNHEQATGAHFRGSDRLLVTGMRWSATWSLTRDDLLRREPGFGITERLTTEEVARLEGLLRGQESR